MRPKLKGDTFYIPVADGVYLRNNQGSFRIKGKNVYRWLERLAPYLNGHNTLEEIIQGLDVERQAMVTNLVDILLAQQFLKDTSQDLPHTLSATEVETYASEIAFIDSFRNSAASRFERFREQHVLIIGSGLTMTGLVHSCLKCGIRQLAVITTQECETNTRRYYEYLDLFYKGDPRQTLREIDTPLWENEARVLSILQPFDVIIHVSDRPMLARASMLNKLCVIDKKTFLQATLIDDHAWIGPLVRPDIQGCWECASLRLRGNLVNIQAQWEASMLQRQEAAPSSRYVALPTAALVANLLGFEVFKHITEAGPMETIEHLIEVDLETLRTHKHPFLPHPLCHTCYHPTPHSEAQFLNIIEQLQQREPLDQNLFSKQLASCFETCSGIFRSLDEEDFTQLPLSVCKVVVSNPMPQELLDNPRAVLGIGDTFATARQRGAERACEIYSASVVDRRLLLVTPPQNAQILPAERFLSVVPLLEVNEWTWAADLHTGQAHLVPAPLAYPMLRGLSPLDDDGSGVSSGMSWAEAVSKALLKVCQYLTIAQLASTQQPYPQIDLSTISFSSEVARKRYILEQMDAVPIAYDVTGPLQIPTFVLCLQGKAVAYCTHMDVSLALQDGFEQVILQRQLSHEQFPVESLPALPDLPVALRGDIANMPAYDAPQEWLDRKLWLQKVLQKHGWQTFALPLNHDPVLNQIQPYIVRVLVAHA